MTRQEFAQVCAYITAGTGKALSADSLQVYFDLLGDLPADSFLTAARRVLLEHRWPNFPSIADLGVAAAETMPGRVSVLASGEAWELACAPPLGSTPSKTDQSTAVATACRRSWSA